jgi:hypothetical protein
MLTILSHLHNLVANNLQLHGHAQLELVKCRAVMACPQGTIARRPD